MVKRTLLVSVLTFVIVSIPLYFFGERDLVEESPELIRASLIRYYVYITIPLLGGIFLCLLVYNSVIQKRFLDKTTKEKNRAYFIYSTLILLFILFVFLFIFYQDSKGGFSRFLVQHTGYIALLLVAFFLNRKLVWKNFR